MKYLNTHSHHYCHHKYAVLSGVELRLALLTTMTLEIAHLRISMIYPGKHKALWTAWQLKENQEMWTLPAVLEDESRSGPLWLERKSCQTDHCDTLFITKSKYANLGTNTRPINQVLKKLRNQYNLRWLHPWVVYSRHGNLHKKELGDLKQKLLIEIVDADLGQWPCNCPVKFEVNRACAFGNDESCRTAGVVYKVSCCASQSCNCFDIGKLHWYIKNHAQGHIGEVTKLYSKLILPYSQPAMHCTSSTCHSQLTPPTRTSSSSSSTRTQEYYVLPPTYPPQCTIINYTNPPEPMMGLTMQLQWRPHQSDISLISNPGQMSSINSISIPDEAPPSHQPPPNNKQEEHCSALAHNPLSQWRTFISPQEQKLPNDVAKTSK